MRGGSKAPSLQQAIVTGMQKRNGSGRGVLRARAEKLRKEPKLFYSTSAKGLPPKGELHLIIARTAPA